MTNKKAVSILLNESDPARRRVFRKRLESQGHKVWSANHLSEIVSTLHDVPVDLMILDLDSQRLEDLAAFAGRWRGIKILFQGSSTLLDQDFQSKIADSFVSKQNQAENISNAVLQLI